jgi:hypothetical protein
MEFQSKQAKAVHIEFGSNIISLCEEIVKLRAIKSAALELLADCDDVDFSCDGLYPKRAKSMYDLRKALEGKSL